MIDVTYNVPGLLATHAAPNVSDRYNYISTRDVHHIMDVLGWEARVGYTVSSKNTDPLYGKHIIRYCKSSRMMGGEYPEIIWRNAHNGSSSLVGKAGIFKLVCSNGLTIMTEDYGTFSLRHDNPVAQCRFDLMDLVQDYATSVNTVLSVSDRWKTIPVALPERMEFYRKASRLRAAGMTESEMIVFDSPQREEDKANDLWTVFNRTQEYLVRGGFHATSEATNKPRLVREITGINSLDKVNSDLFQLANEVAIAN